MPTTPDAAIRAIETRLSAAFPAVPTLFPNVPFTPPLDRAWLKCWTVWGSSKDLTTKPLWTQQGIGFIQVDICVPQSQGTGAQRRLAEQVRTLFQRLTFEEVRCEGASGLMFHRAEQWLTGAYWCASVRIPFTIIEEVL